MVAISLSSVVVVSAEVREAVAEFLYDIVCETTDKYTEITIGEKSGFVDPELYDWPGAYAPTYMPEGYVFDEKVSSEVDHDILYRNGENIIIIGQFISTHFRVDSEGAELVEEIKIGNSKALLIINDGITSVNWSSGETMLTVSGNGDSDEIVKVAKSIEIFN